MAAEQEHSLAQQRIDRALGLGLPADTPWAEIYAVEDREERKAVATALGWQESPETTSALTRLGLDPYPSWRTLLTDVLQIRHTAPVEEIIGGIKALRQAGPADENP